MKLEGYYGMKLPCYNKPLVNPSNVTCLHGSPWSSDYSQRIMAGTFSDKFTSIHTDDNFHVVEDTDPVHLAQLNNSCPEVGTGDCTIESITVSQNIYGDYDKMDTGYYPISASETKTKMMSRQASQEHAGDDNANFTLMDEDGNRCADIND